MLQWKLASSTVLLQIATGPNPVANLLDVLALATLRRMELEDLSRNGQWPEGLDDLVGLSRTLELNAWNLAQDIIKPAQQEELRRSLEEWHRSHPVLGRALISRPQEFAAEIRSKAAAAPAGSDSVLSLFSLDPAAGLDPAVREVTQTRLFAERAMYSLQRLPTLVRWQTELLARRVLNLSEVGVMVTNTTALTESATASAGPPSRSAAPRRSCRIASRPSGGSSWRTWKRRRANCGSWRRRCVRP